MFGAVTQLSTGQRWLDANLDGHRAHVAYHIDSFGHAAATPALFLMAGFNAIVLNRIDDREKARRASNKQLEFWWQTSYLPSAFILHICLRLEFIANFIDNASIFTHILRFHYAHAFQTQHWTNALVEDYRSSFRTNDVFVSVV